MLAAVIVIFALPIFSGIATWLLVYDLTSSKWSASVLAVLAAGLVIGAFFVAGKSISDKYLDFPIFSSRSPFRQDTLCSWLQAEDSLAGRQLPYAQSHYI